MERSSHDRAEPSVAPSGTLGAHLRRSRHWLLSHSVRVRLYAVFALTFLSVVAMGIIGVAHLSDVNHASEVIRNHWLRDTRILGDLSNYMSDYRTAEATLLLSSTPVELDASEHEIAALRDQVRGSQNAYEEISQDASESSRYADFAKQWALYLSVAAQVIALDREGRRSEAVVLYNTDSRRAFDVSSDILSKLTDQTVIKARDDSDRATATYSHARNMVVTAMTLSVLLLLGVIVYVSRSLLAPLLELVGSMYRLAAHQTDRAIPGLQRDDEIGEMARAVAVFRDNAVALMTSQRRLIEQAAALEGGLENERRLTAQQRDFASMTSHEFRTPLTIIDGHAQRLIKTSDRLDAADVAERGERIRGAVRRITLIMDSLLGASRVLDGQAVFHPADLDPEELLRDACQVHRDANHEVCIVENFADLPTLIRGDGKLLFHAFSNLLSNAVKYSTTGSLIEVLARQESHWLVVQVTDHGIGIPARDRERLFERYYRGSNATAVAGTGVGLHLVAMVVNLHEGEVFAESLEGVGSRFVIRLPIAAPDLSQVPSDLHAA